MKASLAIAALAFVAPLSAQTINWTDDSPTEFTLTISGTLDQNTGGGWNLPDGVTFAPTPAWQYSYGGFTITPSSDPSFQFILNLDASSVAEDFTGPYTTAAYTSALVGNQVPSLPIIGGLPFTFNAPPLLPGWAGEQEFEFYFPNANDPSILAYQYSIDGFGNGNINPVPEGYPTARLLLAGAFALVAAFRPRRVC